MLVGRYGRLSNIRHGIRDLPIPPHLFSQLNRHREGLDFLRTSGQLSTIFSVGSLRYCIHLHDIIIIVHVGDNKFYSYG